MRLHLHVKPFEHWRQKNCLVISGWRQRSGLSRFPGSVFKEGPVWNHAKLAWILLISAGHRWPGDSSGN